MLKTAMIFLIFFSLSLVFKTGTCNNWYNDSTFLNAPIQEQNNLSSFTSNQALLLLKGDEKFVCGASVINRKYLITAASCVRDKKGRYQVILVSTNNGKEHIYSVNEIRVHPKFSEGSFQNDIALLQLKNYPKFTKNVKEKVNGEENEDGTVYGFGPKSRNGQRNLKYFEIREVAFEECKKAMGGENLSANNFCGRCLKDKCHSCEKLIHRGDSLIKKGELIGIVSLSPFCEKNESVMIFTKVRPHLGFIRRMSSSFRDAKKKVKKDKKDEKTKKGKKVKNSKKKKGKKGKKEETFPYHASIAIKGKKPHCGGTIISDKIVITADQCFKENQTYVAFVGSTKFNKGKQFDLKIIHRRRIVTKSLLVCCLMPCHGYGWITKPFPYKGLSLPKKGEKFKDGEKAILVSYGLMKRGGKPSMTLKSTKLSIMEAKKCKKFEKLGNGILCSGDARSGRSSCDADLGAPLVANNKLVGIALGCIKKNGPVVYENIRHTIHIIEKELKKIKK